MSDGFYNLAGGREWTEREAKKFYSETPGKVESIRYGVNRILGQDLSKVERGRIDDYNKLIEGAKQVKVSVEERWVLLQAYAAKGWSDPANRAEAKFQFQKILDMEKGIKESLDKQHRWVNKDVFETAWQGIKTGGLAPERGAIELMLRKNFVGMASALKIAKERKPSAYEAQRTKWLQLGGNRTKFDAAVEAGAKKKPFLAKDTRKTYSAEGEAPSGPMAPDTAGENPNTLKKIESVSSEMAKVQFPPKGSGYVQLPVGIGSVAAAAITASSSGSAAAYAVPAGVVLDGICLGINAAKIPRKANEENVSAPDYSDIAGDLKQAGTQRVLKNVAIYGGIAVGATGLIYLTYRLLTPKK